jgi:hypothetical protein
VVSSAQPYWMMVWRDAVSEAGPGKKLFLMLMVLVGLLL